LFVSRPGLALLPGRGFLLPVGRAISGTCHIWRENLADLIKNLAVVTIDAGVVGGRCCMMRCDLANGALLS